MLTMEQLGASSDKQQFEMLLSEGEDARKHREDVERLLAGRKFNAPVLYSIDQAFDLVAANRMQLWMIRIVGEDKPCLFMLTEIVQYPAGKTVNVCLTAGAKLLPAARQLFTLFLAWSMKHEIDYIECTTKPSVMRALVKLGFTPTGVRLHYPLRRMQ